MENDKALAALREYFGYESFRPNQRELVDRVIAGGDVMGVMPTGAGKSIVYQIPALVMDGTAIVVSPLISLMKDQVGSLAQAGVPAAFLNSSLEPHERDDVFGYVGSGACKLLYVAPERLDDARFLALAERIAISLVAVDEAHCVSQWGQDFRPSYLRIAAFIDRLPVRPPVCALTATATPDVQADIARALELRDPMVVVSGFDRPNLYFGVERPDPKRKAATLVRLVRERSGQAGIVYCSTRAAVEEVCDRLRAEGIVATRYHAGLSADERQANQDDFLYDRADVMVATNAFGMGIDKSNVSFVVHYNMPSDVESYYQEAGRAGRDGSPADCILIYNKKDVQTCQFLIDKSYDERNDDEASRVVYERDCERLRQMVFYCTTTDCLRSFILRYFGQTDTPYRCEHCSNCVTDFEVEDATVDAQKIISCVLRLDQRGRSVGKTMVVDILRGSKSEKLLRSGFDTLSTYGIMADVPAKRVRYVLDAVVGKGLLAQTDGTYPVVRVTEAGARFLKERESFEVKMPKRVPKTEAPSVQEGRGGAKAKGSYGASGSAAGAGASAENGADRHPDLFDRLKALRLDIAAREGVPAYVVFSNATLSDMCAKLPRTVDEFLEINGVGLVKADRYAKAFLAEIVAWVAERD